MVISGKGGTGKTSVVASLAALAGDAVLVDCDVEAPDLHLVLSPEREQAAGFVGGKKASLRWDLCIGCGRCAELCRFGAILPYGPPNRFADHTYIVNDLACEGCNVCAALCPGRAIEMVEVSSGEWYISRTRHGPLVHARLKPGHGNSGKLVALLRKEARALAQQQQKGLILGDGVPGIGCPVIASIGGADLVLAVVEPSISGLHDFQRVVELTAHFSVATLACINKFDIDHGLTTQIEEYATGAGVTLVGRIPYDTAVVAAQMQGQSVVEHGDGPAAAAIREVWQQVRDRLEDVPAASRKARGS